MLKWDSSYSVGIKEIDDQHNNLIDLINDLERAMNESNAREAIVQVLNGLVVYTREHFSTEETYFKLFEYEDSESHIQEHLKLIAEVENLVYKFEVGDPMDLHEVMDFLHTWLVEHIMGADKEYMACFTDNGLK